MKINANKKLDEEVYVVMEDVPTSQFDFVVKQAEVAVVDALGPPVNAFDVLRAASSRVHLLLPPPRATRDNSADDKLFNDFRGWLEENGVGWPRNEVGLPRPSVPEPHHHRILFTNEQHVFPNE
jgi:hypothetical protein